MKNWIICLFLVLSLGIKAQETKPQYFELAENNEVRFFFDKSYYLVDKNCEFFSIERIAKFDPKTSLFIGAFTDYDLQGRVIMEGEYKQGIKSGLFRAYHPNGQLKWEVTFEQGKPNGDWAFYYPDGKPLMTINILDDSGKLMDYWTPTGSQAIKEGNGKYDFKIPFQGYNPYGYPFVRQRGIIRNGKPAGYWKIYFEDDKGSVLVAEEIYDKEGNFKSAFDLYTESDYDKPRYPLSPIEQFSRAESLVSKDCSFDEHADFTQYLASSLTKSFEMLELTDFSLYNLEYTVQITKQGIPRKIDIKSKINREFDYYFEQAVDRIENYLPSFKNGEYVDDEITVKVIAQPTANGGILFHSVKIIRKAENP